MLAWCKSALIGKRIEGGEPSTAFYHRLFIAPRIDRRTMTHTGKQKQLIDEFKTIVGEENVLTDEVKTKY